VQNIPQISDGHFRVSADLHFHIVGIPLYSYFSAYTLNRFLQLLSLTMSVNSRRVWINSELQGGILQGQSARQALIGQRLGHKLADYPLVIKLPCRHIVAWPYSAYYNYHCHAISVQTSACT